MKLSKQILETSNPRIEFVDAVKKEEKKDKEGISELYAELLMLRINKTLSNNLIKLIDTQIDINLRRVALYSLYVDKMGKEELRNYTLQQVEKQFGKFSEIKVKHKNPRSFFNQLIHSALFYHIAVTNEKAKRAAQKQTNEKEIKKHDNLV